MFDEWWRGACIYQIYPRSFADSNNDGVGDLKGITSKLDYVAGLGVDGVWISPFFTSPMKDYGYDVSNYRDIDPMFGSLQDFQTLLDKAHDLNLKIIIDLVLSHTSDQHPWFTESRIKGSAKDDWYVWADPKPDGSPPNNWVSCFGGSAWEWSAARGQYYLHNFLKEQPDLNFHNPQVQDAVLDVARFWLDKGVDGFRMDVVNFYFHDRELRDNPPRPADLGPPLQFEGDDPYASQAHIYDKSRPENLEFLARFRNLMDKYDDRFTVGEIGDDHPYARASEYTAGSKYLNTSYNTQMMGGKHKVLNRETIGNPFARFSKHPGGGWPSWAFTNHDVVRAVSRWHVDGPDDAEGFSHDARLAKMLLVLLGCLRGTIFLYQGEELGLPEAKLEFKDLHDPWGIHLWPEWQGRDGCRTPMPWINDFNGGFSKKKPWLPVPYSHLPLNVRDQHSDPESVLNFTRAFLKWRQSQTILKIGEIFFPETDNETLLIIERDLEDQKLVGIFNLGLEDLEIPSAYKGETVYEGEVTGDILNAYGFKLLKL